MPVESSPGKPAHCCSGGAAALPTPDVAAAIAALTTLAWEVPARTFQLAESLYPTLCTACRTSRLARQRIYQTLRLAARRINAGDQWTCLAIEQGTCRENYWLVVPVDVAADLCQQDELARRLTMGWL